MEKDVEPPSGDDVPRYRSTEIGWLGPTQMAVLADVHPQGPLQGNGNGGIASPGAFDPFVTTPTPMTPGAVGPVSANPYSHDPTAAMGGAFFANQSGFQQPVS